ncbi:MAG: hypothetical protein ACRENJ_10840 [Candidatus Eiseniibacteriota bacterium]
MDRARDAGAPGPRLGGDGAAGGDLIATRRTGAAPLALLAALGCGRLGTDLDVIVALEVSLPDSGIVEETATIVPRARALNGRGDSVAATITWAALDTAFVAVVDTETGATLGKRPGTGRIQARVGNLRTNPLAITVREIADTAFAEGDTRDTVTVSAGPDSLSDSLRVRLRALVTLSGTAQDVRSHPVSFGMTTYPAAAANLRLVPSAAGRTNTQGLAVVQVRLTAEPLPDSVVVAATAQHANGTPVPGSPITFVVEFRP